MDMTSAEWTSRRRVETALAHREPDRVPYDLGGTILTGIHQHAYRHLRNYLGLPRTDIHLEDVCQQLARVDEDVKERLHVDVWGINPGKVPHAAPAPWTEDGFPVKSSAADNASRASLRSGALAFQSR